MYDPETGKALAVYSEEDYAALSAERKAAFDEFDAAVKDEGSLDQEIVASMADVKNCMAILELSRAHLLKVRPQISATQAVRDWLHTQRLTAARARGEDV